MKLSEYSDDELLEEVKHRGFEITVHLESWVPKYIMIGGIRFELTT